MMGKDGSAYSAPEEGAASAPSRSASGDDALLPGTPGTPAGTLPPLTLSTRSEELASQQERRERAASENWKSAERKITAALAADDLYILQVRWIFCSKYGGLLYFKWVLCLK